MDRVPATVRSLRGGRARALAVEAYFTISDFFVHVVLDQDEMTVVYVRPMRSGSGMGEADLSCWTAARPSTRTWR